MDIHTHVRPFKDKEELERNFNFWKGILGAEEWGGAALIAREKSYKAVGELVLDRWAQGKKDVVLSYYMPYKKPDALILKNMFDHYGLRLLKMHSRQLYREKGDYKIFDSPEWNEVFRECRKLNLPIIWHIFQRHGASDYRDSPAKSDWEGLNYSNPEVLALLEKTLEKHRKTVFIIAHMGHMSHARWDTLLAKHSNLCFETAASGFIKEYDRFTPEERSILVRFYSKWQDRVLFGTDFSWGKPPARDEFYPVYEVNRWTFQRDYFAKMNLPSKVLQKIQNGNAKKLFGLD